MNAEEVLAELESYGSEQTKKVLLKHGAQEPFFGVKAQDLKKIQKKIKHDQALAADLFKTGNSDAMYLAAMISTPSSMSKDEIRSWVEQAYWYYLSEYAVAWVVAESKYPIELALEFIESKKENVASTGWAALSSYVGLVPDDKIDIDLIAKLLERAKEEVHTSQNRVRYVMNGFIIAVGCYIKDLTDMALDYGTQVGKVSVDMGGTACKVPLAKDYILKVIDKNRIGKKRKTAFC